MVGAREAKLKKGEMKLKQTMKQFETERNALERDIAMAEASAASARSELETTVNETLVRLIFSISYKTKE